ncbi:hypothetical protein ACMU_00720 [Actibacterium mucosum KCTC 23349]|uniref:HTH gntR-type domain-containing protein n=2 Tax=Actibacterium TaxID=1433986 RepID=A0A037ZQC6_9RHOB|nr:hypothetical protein ACMU_00720 [Actibacterium mucosum KCTC 23349]
MTEHSLTAFALPEGVLSSLPSGSVKVVVDELGRRIADQVYPVGETIPMESELIPLFGVSRTVVREAIKVLTAKGMLRTARRYGTRVCAFENWHLLDPDVIRWHGPNSPMSSRIYAESTEMRCIFEPQAAGLAAINATDEQRQTILLAARHIRPDDAQPDQMIAADFAFHATILDATGNIMLSQLQGLILALLQFSYPTGASAVPDEKVSRRNHIAVAECIMARDAEGARDKMQAMLNQNQIVAEKMVLRRG